MSKMHFTTHPHSADGQAQSDSAPVPQQLIGLLPPAHAGLFAQSTTPVRPGVFVVTNNADSGAGSLRQAILNANAADAANPGQPSRILFHGTIGTIALQSALPVLNYDAATNSFFDGTMTIDASGAKGAVTIDGGNAQRVFFAGAGDVTISHLTIADGLAQGGLGGGAGGGGLGAGGGLFVNQGTNVTLNQVGFVHDSAVGGAGSGYGNSPYNGLDGGGGGMGGFGGEGVAGNYAYAQGGNGYGGGGGGGSYGGPGGNGGGAGSSGAGAGLGGSSRGGPTDGGLFGGGGGGSGGSQNGGNGGDFGGGGGSGFQPGSYGTGGTGGFGGGGGSGSTTGGQGGFGGGGGAALEFGGGSGGFAGGAGDSYNGGYFGYGGGGGALGGAIFVRSGGSLTIVGGGISGGSVTGGVGGAGYNGSPGGGAGTGIGSGAFFQNGVTTNWQVGTGHTVTVSDDLGGSTDARNGAGTSVLDKQGSGTLDLTGQNSFGATKIDGGVLEAGSAGSLGVGHVTFSANAHAVLQLDAPASFTNVVAGFDAGDMIDLRGFAFSKSETLAFTATAKGGTLTVTDGAQTATLHLLGQFSLADFHLASDQAGGTDLRMTHTAAALPDQQTALAILPLENATARPDVLGWHMAWHQQGIY